FHRGSVVIASWGTPGPIPNPEAKPDSADGTATEGLWESRTPPNTTSHSPAPVETPGLPGPGHFSYPEGRLAYPNRRLTHPQGRLAIRPSRHTNRPAGYARRPFRYGDPA